MEELACRGKESMGRKRLVWVRQAVKVRARYGAERWSRMRIGRNGTVWSVM